MAFFKRLLLELAASDSYEINLLFSINDIFGKFVTSYDKNVLTAFQIFLLSCHESHLVNETFHDISYSLSSLIQCRNCIVPYTVLNFHLFIFCIFVFKIGSFYNCFNCLSANLRKWSNTLKQFVGNLLKNCVSVFDRFVNLAPKQLTVAFII